MSADDLYRIARHKRKDVAEMLRVHPHSLDTLARKFLGGRRLLSDADIDILRCRPGSGRPKLGTAGNFAKEIVAYEEAARRLIQVEKEAQTLK